MKKLLVFALFTMFFFAQGKEQGLKTINEDLVKAQLEFLASDWMEGRAVAQRGEYIAGDYIASMFKVYGIKPAGDFEVVAGGRGMRGMPQQVQKTRSYFQKINLIEYKAGDKQSFEITSNNQGTEETLAFNYKTDYDLNVSTYGVNIKSPVVFVGYGINDKDNNYNDFKGIDVKGKIILRLDGFPGHQDTSSAAYKKFRPKDRMGIFQIRQNKNKAALDAGAVAVIEVQAGRNLQSSWTTNVPFRFTDGYVESDKKLDNFYSIRMSPVSDSLNENLTSVNVSDRVLNYLLKDSGINFNQYEENAKNGKKNTLTDIKNKSVKICTTVDTKIVTARNVVGMIEGENPNEYIVLGAHYDHVGMYDGFVWNGADDNASGTVGVMTIAKAFSECGVKPKRTIIFACWTGEERGLFGSRHFANNFKDGKIILNQNYDMISRDSQNDKDKNQCSFTYTSGFDLFKQIAEENIKQYKLNLVYNFRSSERPGGGSDHASFAAKGIPVISQMAAMHEEYHKPNDQIEKVNFPKMTNIIKSGFLNIYDLANYPSPIEKK